MRLLIQLLVLSTLNLMLRFIALVLSVIMPLFIAALRILCIPVFMAFTATVLGPREYVGRVAYEWAQWLIDRGADPREIDRIERLCRVLVSSTLVIGWAFTGLFIVTIFRVVFGFFI